MNKHLRNGLFLSCLVSLALGCDEPPTSEVGAVEASEPTPRATSFETPVPTAVVAPSAWPDAVAEPEVAEPEVAEPEVTTVAAPEMHAERGLSLRRLALARRVADHEPVDPSTRFEARAERLYAFVDARNDDAEDRELVVTFVGPDHRRTGEVTLTIPAGARRWRTWAYTSHASAAGDWAAEIRTPEGALVGRQAFVLE